MRGGGGDETAFTILKFDWSLAKLVVCSDRKQNVDKNVN
jgi:hypothetical protein